jgi:hypothetical protein
VAVNASFAASSNVANTITGSAYDCRFTQSPVSVTIAAAATQSSPVMVSAGTVAGTCVFGTAALSVPTQNFQISPPESSVQLANSTPAPYIAQVSETSSPGSATLTLVVTGYSMTRDLQSLTYTFTTTQSGFSVTSAPVVVMVNGPANTWYSSSGSAATGGQFQYTQQFSITASSGTATSANLASVSVTATSASSGNSPPVTTTLN